MDGYVRSGDEGLRGNVEGGVVGKTQMGFGIAELGDYQHHHNWHENYLVASKYRHVRMFSRGMFHRLTRSEH